MSEEKTLDIEEEIAEQSTQEEAFKIADAPAAEDNAKGLKKLGNKISSFFTRLFRKIAIAYSKSPVKKVVHTIFHYIGLFFYYLFYYRKL